jgi:hypothetical protein
MSANGEEEDDVSNIFNRNSGSNNHPQSRPHIGDDDIDIEENQHGTSHSDLFNRSNHNSEDGDEFMADPDNRLETLIEELQSMYHLNNHYGPHAAKSVKVSCPVFAFSVFPSPDHTQSNSVPPTSNSQEPSMQSLQQPRLLNLLNQVLSTQKTNAQTSSK